MNDTHRLAWAAGIIDGEGLLPWLLVKHDQAELGLQSRRLMTPMRGRRGRHRPAEVETATVELAQQMKRLKLREFVSHPVETNGSR